MRKYNLPVLSHLHSFEVVARRLSFTDAADELCVTQSAVSRQIKALEQELGVALFQRGHRRIDLTDAGRQLFDAVTRGLDEIAVSVSALRTTSAAPQITVAASTAFSYYWLMPRLERFSDRHPEIDLRILASDQQADLRRGDADVAILYGDGQWPGISASRLFGEEVYPVCSPAYAQAHPELRRSQDFLDQTLVHLEGGGNIWGAVDWQSWLTRQGVTGQPVRRGIVVNSYPMVLQSVEAGRGVGLGWSYITDAMVATGQLVKPVEATLVTRASYYTATLEEVSGDPAISEFVQWCLEEAAQ